MGGHGVIQLSCCEMVSTRDLQKGTRTAEMDMLDYCEWKSDFIGVTAGIIAGALWSLGRNYVRITAKHVSSLVLRRPWGMTMAT
jgi:hypothetical protein